MAEHMSQKPTDDQQKMSQLERNTSKQQSCQRKDSKTQSSNVEKYSQSVNVQKDKRSIVSTATLKEVDTHLQSSSSNDEQSHHEASTLQVHRLPLPKMKFGLSQADSVTRFCIHDVSMPHNRVLTEQHSPSPDYFKQRFSLSESQQVVTSTGDLSVNHKPPVQYSVPELPVYREKAVSMLVSSDTTAGHPDNQDSIVQFSLHYDIQQSKLRVYLQCATNLPKAYCKQEGPVQCDPFVMLHLEPNREDTFQSNVVRCTYDPVFDQMFQFGGLSLKNIQLQTLVFQFYNHALNNRAIGKASLQLRDVDLFGVVQMKIVGSKEMEVLKELYLSYNCQ